MRDDCTSNQWYLEGAYLGSAGGYWYSNGHLAYASGVYSTRTYSITSASEYVAARIFISDVPGSGW